MAMKRISVLVLVCNSFVFYIGDQVMGQQLPIKVARTISFETTEGSYMNLDISQDGKTIVFDLLGDIYTLPSNGGIAIQLTRGLAYNRCPVWSPDGQQIAYLSDASGTNRLCVMDANGTGQRTLDLSSKEINTTNLLEAEAMPTWMPDGKYIAVDKQLYHLAGGRVSLPPIINSNVQFSMDEQFMYYVENTSDVRRVQLLNRSTGEVTKLTDLPLGDQYSSVRVSPDGQWLAYVVGPDPVCNLRMRNLKTGFDHEIALSIEKYGRDFKERYTFTPDSRCVLIAYGGKLHRIDVQSGIDKIIPFKTLVKVDLGSFNYNTYRLNNDSVQIRFTRSANSSPDGKTLVFTALRRMYIMDLPSGKPHPLVYQPFGQFQPVFSPNGKWIAYVSWSDTQGGYLWRVPAIGGKPELLTLRRGYYEHPTWSNDGKRLAVIIDSIPGLLPDKSGGLKGELDIVDVDKKTTHKLADDIPIWNFLSFSPDGTSLTAMVSRAGGKPTTLESLNLKGNKRQVLAIIGGDEKFAELVSTGFLGLQMVTISPNRRYIVYQINEDLYLSPLPGLGGPNLVNSQSGIRPIIRFAVGGLDPHWERGGKLLSWSYSNHFCRINPDKIIDKSIEIAKDSASKGLNLNGIIRLNIVPDEVVEMRIKAARKYGHGTIAMRNLRIISMKDNEVIENGTIVITDGRIAAVGQVNSVPVPAHARILNLNGRTVIPGLIDIHDHCDNPPDVFEQQSWKYLANLACGVTTIRDPASSYDAFGYAELLQTGQMMGPRLFSVGYAVGEESLNVITSLDDARETACKRSEMGAIAVKQYQQETRLQRQWLLIACREYGLNMTNEGDYDLRGEIAMIKDGSTGVEHAYQWSNLYDDVIQLIAKSKTWHTPTLVALTDARDYNRDLSRKNKNLDIKLRRFWDSADCYCYEELLNPQKTINNSASSNFIYPSSIEADIYKIGGQIGLGGHGNDPGIGSHWELWSLQMGGLTNLEALKVATIEGAKALGMQTDLGTLETGKIADLIVLEKNPLVDIHNTLSIQYIMKDGILYDGNTLNTIWPVKRKLPAWRLVPQNK